MTLSILFAEGGLTLLGVLIAVAALGCLAGAGIQRLNSEHDLKHERSRAWRIGVGAGALWEVHRRLARPGEVVKLPRDPYTGEAIAPEPPHVTYPGQGLYDQDEPPFLRALRDQLVPADADRVYRAPRVVTDDGEELSPGSGQPDAGTLILPRALLDGGHVEVVKFRSDD
jgi:hypothetical protein